MKHNISKDCPYPIVEYISDIDRSRCIAMVKMNQKGKKSFEGLTCRFCENDLPETQEHLEICDGTKFERRGVRVSEVMGRVIFWRRMTQKMTQKTATVTSISEVHLPVTR